MPISRSSESEKPRQSLLDLDSRPLVDIAPRVPFWRGRIIGVQDQPSNGLYIVAEGQVLLSRRSPGGDDVAMYLLGAGDLFGEGSLRPNPHWLFTSRAVTDGSMHVLPSQHLPRFAQLYPQLAAHLFSLLCDRLERAHIRLDMMHTSSARDRLLRMLQVIGDYHGRPAGEELWIPIRVTQAELGEMVGLARETVARSLAVLEADGLVRRGRQGLWLKQAEQIEA